MTVTGSIKVEDEKEKTEVVVRYIFPGLRRKVATHHASARGPEHRPVAPKKGNSSRVVLKTRVP